MIQVEFYINRLFTKFRIRDSLELFLVILFISSINAVEREGLARV